MCFAWFIWEQGYEGEPTIKWIHPDHCKSTKPLDYFLGQTEKEVKIETLKKDDVDDFWK